MGRSLFRHSRLLHDLIKDRRMTDRELGKRLTVQRDLGLRKDWDELRIPDSFGTNSSIDTDSPQ